MLEKPPLWVSVLANLLVALTLFGSGFGVAWTWQGDRAEVRIKTIAQAHEKARADDATEVARALKQKQDRADEIDRVASYRALVLNQKLQETQNALKTATRGRPCLGGPALRLLGQSPGLSLGTVLPDAAGTLHGRSGAAAAAANDAQDDGEYASDTQIADWIAVAGAQYDRCRSMIGDIRAWNK